MNLYQMKSNPYGTEQIHKFLEDNFVSIGFQGIGDLTGTDEQEMKERLRKAYELHGQELEGQAEAVKRFVLSMQDGDYVMVPDQDLVHLGDLGDYFYDEVSDTKDNSLCHRRGVTWLTRIPRAELNKELQELLDQPEIISQFKQAIEMAELYKWSTNLLENPGSARKPMPIKDEVISEALDILTKALYCEDEERRERAAIAILQYVK